MRPSQLAPFCLFLRGLHTFSVDVHSIFFLEIIFLSNPRTKIVPGDQIIILLVSKRRSVFFFVKLCPKIIKISPLFVLFKGSARLRYTHESKTQKTNCMKIDNKIRDYFHLKGHSTKRITKKTSPFFSY